MHQTIRDPIGQHPKLFRSPLSRRLCGLSGWFKADGRRQTMTMTMTMTMTCRVALLRARPRP